MVVPNLNPTLIRIALRPLLLSLLPKAAPVTTTTALLPLLPPAKCDETHTTSIISYHRLHLTSDCANLNVSTNSNTNSIPHIQVQVRCPLDPGLRYRFISMSSSPFFLISSSSIDPYSGSNSTYSPSIDRAQTRAGTKIYLLTSLGLWGRGDRDGPLVPQSGTNSGKSASCEAQDVLLKASCVKRTVAV
jgi:hypothetical protein